MAQSPCILLCESSEQSEPSLADRLRKAGVHVELAKNVAEAERLLDRNFYDGVALDLLLPDMDGASQEGARSQDHRTPLDLGPASGYHTRQPAMLRSHAIDEVLDNSQARGEAEDSL